MVIRRVPFKPQVKKRRAGLIPSLGAELDREMAVRLGLLAAALFVLTVGLCTLAFWFIAGSTGWLKLGENALYLVRGVGLVGLLLGALALVAVIAAFRRAALPVADLIEAANRVGEGDLELQVEERGPREIRLLARAFNQMAGDLREADAARRQQLVEAIGEMRAPLRLIYESVDGMLHGARPRDDGQIQLMLDETIHLARAAETLEGLAQGEGVSFILRRQPTDLGALVRDTLTEFHRIASARGVALRVQLPDPSPVAAADAARLEAALQQVLVSALDGSTVGGEIDVEVSELHAPERVEIAVATSGGALGPDELARLLDGESPQVGGGLPIARRFLEAHGGRLSVWQDPESGTRFTLTLPRDGGAA